MICKRPTNSLFIDSAGGLRPDPRFDSNIDYIDNYDSLTDYLNSDKLRLIQENFYKEVNINCLDCINVSKNSSFDPMDTKRDKLTTLFLGLSNLCNFECRICGSYASNKLIHRDAMLQSTSFQTQYPVDLKNKGLTEKQLDKLLNNIEIFSHLKFVKINGGEPFLEDKNFFILEKLLPFSDNINVAIITNGSIFPNKTHLKILEQYKSVEISVGLEATGSCYEYVRKNSSWKNVKENILQFSNYFNLNFFVSLTAFSIYDMHNLISYIDNRPVDFQTITRPSYLSHEIFGNMLYHIYPEFLNNYIKNTQPDFTKISKFLSYVKCLDKYYETSLFDIEPKFRDFL